MLLILGAKKPVALNGVKRCPVFDGSCAGALLSKGFYRLKKGWAEPFFSAGTAGFEGESVRGGGRGRCQGRKRADCPPGV